MIVALLLLAVVLGVLGFASAQLGAIHIERTIEIHVPPERVFPLIDDFRQWPQWAPQDTMDPTMQRTFAGSASGLGAVSAWVSKGSAGRGQMEILDSVSPAKVVVGVDFVQPFRLHNTNVFTLEAVSGGTRVCWAMSGTKPYVAKVMSVFVNFDRMMGKHFDTGLLALKKLAEQGS